jgi:hypothetical protein
MDKLSKEAGKRIILANTTEIDKLVTKPRDLEETYHHANFILTQVVLSLLAYTDDEEIHEAVETILDGHELIAERINIRPYIYVEESAYELDFDNTTQEE